MSIRIISSIPALSQIFIGCIRTGEKINVVQVARSQHGLIFKNAKGQLFCEMKMATRGYLPRNAEGYLSAFIALKIITQKQANEHRKAIRIEKLNETRQSHYRQMRQTAEKYGIKLNARVKKIILGKLTEDEVPW